jgi:putative transposase
MRKSIFSEAQIVEILKERAERQQINLWFFQPGKPDWNAFIERFNRSYREEVLDAYLLDSLRQIREISDTRLVEYHDERPHESLGSVSPLMFTPRQTTARESDY